MSLYTPSTSSIIASPKRHLMTGIEEQYLKGHETITHSIALVLLNQTSLLIENRAKLKDYGSFTQRVAKWQNESHTLGHMISCVLKFFCSKKKLADCRELFKEQNRLQIDLKAADIELLSHVTH